jgi:predicted hydrolase (HD superfamily)
VTGESRIDIALVVADQLSGLITAAALIRPDKELAGVQLKSLRKRYREGAFARGVDRASIARCAELGLELDDVLALGLGAMQGIAPDLGL